MEIEKIKNALKQVIDLILLHSWKLCGLRSDPPDKEDYQPIEFFTIDEIPFEELLKNKQLFDAYLTFCINDQTKLFVALGYNQEEPEEYYLEMVAYLETPNGAFDLAYWNRFKFEEDLKNIIVNYMRNVFAFEKSFKK